MNIKYIVYKTTNLINNKIYIGVHRTNIDIFDFYFGCGCYKKDQKKKVTTGFPAALRKYGWKNFKRETLFVFPNTEQGKIDAYNKEAEIVNEDFIKRKDTYNLVKGGKFTIYESLKKPIVQYEIDGTFIKVWDSIQEASMALNLTSISNVLLGVTKYAGNWQWRYYNGDISNIEPITTKEKSIYQFDLQGNLIKCWKSISEASRIFENQKAARVAISNCCLEKVNQAYGYYWSFNTKFNFKTNKHYSAVAKYNDAGEFIKSYTTLIEAAREHGLKTSSNIIACINGKQKHCKGFRWRYFYGNTNNIKPLK